jgi:hypothetical protein
MQQKCSEGSCRKRPISVETVRRYVAENRLTEREDVLLRGSAALRGFSGCLDHSLDWLERLPRGGRAVPGRHIETLAAKHCGDAGVAAMPEDGRNAVRR